MPGRPAAVEGLTRLLRRGYRAAVLLLAACAPEIPAVCSEPVTQGFDPVTEPDLRLESADATWTAEDGAEIVADATQVEVQGPGGAVSWARINRGVEHVATATVEAEGPVLVQLRHLLDSGRELVLDEVTLEGGGTVSLAGTPLENGDWLGLSLSVAAGRASLRELELVGSRWAEADAAPSAEAPLMLGFLIHIEGDAALRTDEAKWRRRAVIFEGLSQTLAAHGAMLTIQPDIGFVRGASEFDPDWLDARAAEGVAWSVHLHDESEGAEAFEQAARDAANGFSAVDIDADDFNGGFALGLWSMLSEVGQKSVTAYKDAATQAGLPQAHVQPWRLADGASTADAAAFATHEPAGPLVYLPGDAGREADHARFPDYGRRTLSQVFGAARPGFVNTWYFMFHVDGFTDGEAESDEYVDSGAFAADLAWYDQFLDEVADPLVDAGALQYASPDDMRRSWMDWESACLAR